MRTKAWLSAAFVLVVGTGACQKYVTEPITRRPVIASVIAFPTILGPGDSTMVTVFATDPDGDALVYDWAGYNGLVMRSHYGEGSIWNNTGNPSMVFYRSTASPPSVDTAFVWCAARDGKGGSDSRQILILYRN